MWEFYCLFRNALKICDRSALEESRKWGTYNIINLLFKTYFKLNSISLSKNVLKAIQAYKGDMPSLDAFPKAHQVTFKYYVGVIQFLEENYVEVRTHAHPIIPLSNTPPSPRKTSPKLGHYATRMLSAIRSKPPTSSLRVTSTNHPLTG